MENPKEEQELKYKESYIKEIEKQNEDLKYQLICLMDTFKYKYLELLKDQNKEMLEFIKEIFVNDIGGEYTWPTIKARELIEKVTGKLIEEVFKNE